VFAGNRCFDIVVDDDLIGSNKNSWYST